MDFVKPSDLAVNSSLSKQILKKEYLLFSVQTKFSNYQTRNLAINRRMKRAFDRWTKHTTDHQLKEIEENSPILKKVMLTKLNVINSIFTANCLDSCFQKWKS